VGERISVHKLHHPVQHVDEAADDAPQDRLTRLPVVSSRLAQNGTDCSEPVYDSDNQTPEANTAEAVRQ